MFVLNKDTRTLITDTLLVSLLLTLSGCYYGTKNDYLGTTPNFQKKKTTSCSFHLTTLCRILFLQFQFKFSNLLLYVVDCFYMSSSDFRIYCYRIY